jgi:hypothetical protein
MLLDFRILIHQCFNLLFGNHQFLRLRDGTSTPHWRAFKIMFDRLLRHHFLQLTDRLLEFDRICVRRSILLIGFVKLAFDYAIRLFLNS